MIAPTYDVALRLKRARKDVLFRVNRMIAPLETIGSRAGDPLTHRPIFVVGPPRSGTTLLVQVVIAACEVGYFSNLMNALWGAPSLAARLTEALGRRGPDDFQSDLGNTPQWLGFSEAPNYWLRFFPRRPHCLDVGDVPPADLARLRAAVRRLVGAFGKPVVFKTIENLGRLRAIAAALPEALFLVSQRDPLAIGHSLLEARRKRASYEEWLSFEPPGIDELKRRPPHEQVLETILRSYELLRADAAAIGRERFLDVRYDELCSSPHAGVARVAAFAGLATREGWRNRVPILFPPPRPKRSSPEIHDALIAYHDRRVRGTAAFESMPPLPPHASAAPVA